MKKRMFVAIVAALISLSVFQSCDPKTAVPASVDAISEVLAAAPETKTFKAENVINFTSASGKVRIYIPANALIDPNGNAVTGDVTLTFREVLTQSQMIANNRPTQTTDGKLLESAGAFQASLSKGATPLSLKPGKNATFSIKSVNAGEMDIFYGKTDETGTWEGWVADSTPLVPSVTIIQDTFENYIYQGITSDLNWINCDRFWDVPSTSKTTLTANLPSDFTNENTQVYMVFKAIYSVAGFFTTNIDTKFQSIETPLDEDVTVLAIGVKEVDGEKVFYLDHKDVKITNSLSMNLEPKEISETDLKAFIKSL
jgi:hypothetical protein